MLSRIAFAAMPPRRAMLPRRAKSLRAKSLRVKSVRVMSSGALLFGLLSVAGVPGPALVTAAHAQAGPGDDVMYRIERLENQLRQMTGEIEQLQYHNQQLEAAINELRGGARVAAPPPGAAPPLPPGAAPPLQGAGAPAVYAGSGRHSDAFDPTQSPNAPGAPRTLGSIAPQPPPPGTRPGMQPTPYATGGGDPPYGRPPGGADQGYGRPPAGAPAQAPGAAYPVATAAPPPSGSPRDTYEAGVVYLQRRDYAAAEETFRDFLRRYPSDRMAAEAEYNLGESLFQRQSYQEAADAFVQLSKKYETSTKAPDALLRLGQSLAAMNETELACVAFADVGRKYPRARPEVRQAVEREQKRARCS